jgi:hypothetical protein
MEVASMADPEELEFRKVGVRRTDADDYELGAEADGHWVSFARIPGEQLRANVANMKATADAQTTEQS